MDITNKAKVILSLLSKGYSQKKICEETGYNKSTVSYYCGERYLNDIKKREKKEKETEARIRSAVNKCNNITQVCKYLGKKPITNNLRIISSLIDRYNIDTSHFKIDHERKQSHRYTYDEVFCKGSLYPSSKIKSYILRHRLKPYVCEECGNTEWMGNPIPLQAHHINGDHNDNRFENIKLICPNCHSITDNYCGKKLKKD